MVYKGGEEIMITIQDLNLYVHGVVIMEYGSWLGAGGRKQAA
jgi:hypothetical protein